jgi:hypothetical protein
VKLTATIVALLLAFGAARYMASGEREPDVDRESPAWRARIDALSRARVFADPAPSVASQPLDTNPRDRRPFDAGERVVCDYVPKAVSGTTPKFDCRLPAGEMVKVKYGRTPEVHAEVAATRLLAALGFAADHVSFVRELQCRGCPPAPYRTRQVAELFFLSRLVDWFADSDAFRTYRDVAVERKFEGDGIEAAGFKGWQWAELDLVKPERGGAGRGELDALRLMAVVLGHWDNKSSNQRLVCLDTGDDSSAGQQACAKPLLMLQDLGSTFGPRKLNQERWSRAPVFIDAERCVVSMRDMPYDGATFVDATISEAGRSLLARRLRSLSDAQIQALFLGAAFPDPDGDASQREQPTDVSDWVRTLKDKIAQVAERAPCPAHFDTSP